MPTSLYDIAVISLAVEICRIEFVALIPEHIATTTMHFSKVSGRVRPTLVMKIRPSL